MRTANGKSKLKKKHIRNIQNANIAYYYEVQALREVINYLLSK